MFQSKSIVGAKSFDFAIEIINLYKYLIYKKKEFIISKQLLKSGTSIGANVEEALGAISKKEFRAKMGIAYKESRETAYWLKILYKTGYIDFKSHENLQHKCEELLKILYKIVKNTTPS